ncbi:hypothetical protein VTN77DRAFT_8637 [Rasamsonia byssochlamydoides]|uniref:uncharacterized protein n=1 Tax=Rasamsonia byssochlamydoides TaxID=89139 RepID=UPI0037438CAB
MLDSSSSRETEVSREDTLTDDDIQQLLLQAETRLRSSESSTSNTSNSALVTDGDNNVNFPQIPKIPSSQGLQSYIHQKDDVATVDRSRVIDPSQKKLSDKLWSVEALTSTRSKAKEKQTAGADWFDLPKTKLTPELKRDLQLLRMRSVLDPKRHYKKETGKAKPPEFSQVGTVIEGPTEFFSARIPKRDRKSTFVEEAMALERESGKFKARYNAIQVAKASGKKAYYKALRAKRRRRGTT